MKEINFKELEGVYKELIKFSKETLGWSEEKARKSALMAIISVLQTELEFDES